MSLSDWEKHTLLASKARESGDEFRCILHYQQALNASERILEDETIELEDKIFISISSCHNLADFWNSIGDSEYELKYLELASERVLMLVPQCHKTDCESYISSLGCCKKALVSFMKRHPNPKIASLVKNIDSASSCHLIAKFKMN